MGKLDTEINGTRRFTGRQAHLTSSVHGDAIVAPGVTENARDRIRDAAIESFAYEGFNVGMRAIASRAGVTAGLITHYYRSKARLQQECDNYVLGYLLERTPGSLEARIPDSGDLADPDRLMQVVHYINRAITRGDSFAEQFFNALYEQLLREIKAAIAEGKLEASENEEARAKVVLRHACGVSLVDFALDPPHTIEATHAVLREFWDRSIRAMLNLSNGRSFDVASGTGGYLERAEFNA